MSRTEPTAWRCTVCGYVHQGAKPPDFCPVCGAASTEFEPYEEPRPAPKTAAVRHWRCLNCSYVHSGDRPPNFCPVCGAPAKRFEPFDELSTHEESSATNHVIIIGGGIASVSAAETVRSSAPGAIITLICQEAMPPYYRLNLTRYLAGEIERGALPVHDTDWYGRNRIDLRIGAAVQALDTAEHEVILPDGQHLTYDKLILAMGSHPFVPPIPGTECDGVLTFRTADDADDVLRRVGQSGRCVVIGGGILGLEVAGALSRQDSEVTLVESHAWLMPRQLTREAAIRLEAHIAGLGIDLVKHVRTREIIGNGDVTGILLDSGELIETPLVILATGVRPNTYLVRKAGLDVNKGVLVNNYLQTSDPSIYAAGDIAEHNGRLYGAWAPSQYQGTIAGLNAVGIRTTFGGLPRSNSIKVLGIDLLSIGQFEPEDGSFLVFDRAEDKRFAHFVFHDGKLVGCNLLDYPLLGPVVKSAIEQRRDFSALLQRAKTGADVIAYIAG